MNNLIKHILLVFFFILLLFCLELINDCLIESIPTESSLMSVFPAKIQNLFNKAGIKPEVAFNASELKANKKDLQNKIGIYVILNPEIMEAYVGESSNLAPRASHHLPENVDSKDPNARHQSNKELRKAIIEHGVKKFWYFVMEFTSLENLKSRETFYMKFFIKLGFSLYNFKGGGPNGINRAATKALLSERAKERWASEAARRAHSKIRASGSYQLWRHYKSYCKLIGTYPSYTRVAKKARTNRCQVGEAIRLNGGKLGTFWVAGKKYTVKVLSRVSKS